MKEKKHTGFEDYLTTGTFTPEFIHDYEYWCKRIFYKWKRLAIDFDTFYETCWEALLTKIDLFDPKIATIQTFCISRINNEAWRFYMKYKTRRPEVDCNSEVVENTLMAETRIEDIKRSMDDFALYCNKQGVEVNLDELYKDYVEEKESAPMIAYTWWKATNREVRGSYDFCKKRR